MGNICSKLLIKKKVKKNATKFRIYCSGLLLLEHVRKQAVSGTGSNSVTPVLGHHFIAHSIAIAAKKSINADRQGTKRITMFSCVQAI